MTQTARILPMVQPMPATRAGCEHIPRPCPHVRCRHNLRDAVQTDLFGNSAPDSKPTCALDEAENGPKTLEEIAQIFGVTRERVRQIELIILRKAKSGDGEPSWSRPEDVIVAVLDVFGVEFDEVVGSGPTRDAVASDARDVICYCLSRKSDMEFSEIGGLLRIGESTARASSSRFRDKLNKGTDAARLAARQIRARVRDMLLRGHGDEP